MQVRSLFWRIYAGLHLCKSLHWKMTNKYIFIRLQIAAVCILAFWLFVSPPDIINFRQDFSKLQETSSSSSSKKNRDSPTALQRYGGTAEEEPLPETSPTVVARVRGEGKDPAQEPTAVDSVMDVFDHESSENLAEYEEETLAPKHEVMPVKKLKPDRKAHKEHPKDLTPTVHPLTPDQKSTPDLNLTLPRNASSKHKPSKKHRWHLYWYDREFATSEDLPTNTSYTWPISKKDDKRHVIFNRVGKCGSRSVLNLLKILAENNQFYLISSQTFNQRRIKPPSQEKLVSILSTIESPFIYQRHLLFVNFTEYGKQQPTYINIIRDPLERAISHYYFIRFGDERKEDRGHSSDHNKLMSYEDCVLQKLPECVGFKAFYITPFFCGNQPKCKEPSEWAFEEAKANVKKYYLAVGVLEELEDSLQVFQKVLPNMFNGALDTFTKFEESTSTNRSSVGVTKYKKRPSEKTALYVKNVIMHWEYKFYYWIKDRLHHQMQELGLTPYTTTHR